MMTHTESDEDEAQIQFLRGYQAGRHGRWFDCALFALLGALVTWLIAWMVLR